MANVISRRTFLKTTTAGSLGAALLFNSYECLAGGGNTNFDSIRNKIKKAVESDSPASLAVAVAKDGKIMWEELSAGQIEKSASLQQLIQDMQ
jgi:hypothetical protein